MSVGHVPPSFSPVKHLTDHKENLARMIEAYCDEYSDQPFQRAHLASWLHDKHVNMSMQEAVPQVRLTARTRSPHSVLVSTMRLNNKTTKKHKHRVEPYQRPSLHTPRVQINENGHSVNVEVKPKLSSPRAPKRSASDINFEVEMPDYTCNITISQVPSATASAVSRASPKRALKKTRSFNLNMKDAFTTGAAAPTAIASAPLSAIVLLPDQSRSSFVFQPSTTICELRTMVSAEIQKKHSRAAVEGKQIVLKNQQGWPHADSDYVYAAAKPGSLLVCYLEPYMPKTMQ